MLLAQSHNTGSYNALQTAIVFRLADSGILDEQNTLAIPPYVCKLSLYETFKQAAPLWEMPRDQSRHAQIEMGQHSRSILRNERYVLWATLLTQADRRRSAS